MSTGAERTTRIEIEVDEGADPIRGGIGRPPGPPARFSGWLELIGAIERIRGVQPPGRPAAQEGLARDGDQGSER